MLKCVFAKPVKALILISLLLKKLDILKVIVIFMYVNMSNFIDLRLCIEYS